MSKPNRVQTEFQHVVGVAKERFVMDLDGIHGVSHWLRVRENGLHIAEQSGADPLIVELFAFLHDCCREDDGTDPGHGARAAEFSLTLRGSILRLGDADFALLHEAIRDHELGLTKGDITVLTCWDADRLDLGRVGIRPDPRYLCTEFARKKETIAWALKRSGPYW
jgi:uncharacterized protein